MFISISSMCFVSFVRKKCDCVQNVRLRIYFLTITCMSKKKEIFLQKFTDEKNPDLQYLQFYFFFFTKWMC